MVEGSTTQTESVPSTTVVGSQAEPAKPTQSEVESVAFEIIKKNTDPHGNVAPDVSAKVKHSLKTREGLAKSQENGVRKPEESAANDSTANQGSNAEGQKADPDVEARTKEVLARRALKRAKWDDADIDALAPELLVRLGMKAKAEQDEQARSYAKATHAPNKDAKAEVRKDDPAESVRSQPEPGDEPEGLESILEELPDDDARLLKERLARAERLEAEAQARIVDAQRVAVAAWGSQAKNRLAADFPGLSEEGRWGQVRDVMDRLHPEVDLMSVTPEEIESDMRDACLIVFGKDVLETSRRTKVERTRRQLDGQPDVGTRRGPSRGAMTKEEFDSAVFRIVQEHPDDPLEQRKKIQALRQA